jgi:hypothetical protein
MELTIQKPPPKCKAILLCDYVIQDAVTGKNTLVGIFDQFIASAYPFQMPHFHLFLHLVDGIGSYDLSVEIHDLRDATIIARVTPKPLEFRERINRTNLILPFNGAQLPHDGAYDFVVLANGQEIDRKQVRTLFPRRQPNSPNSP